MGIQRRSRPTVLASTWAAIANLIDQDELATFTDTIGEEIAAVEEQLLAFDQANPRIALIDRSVEPGDAFLMAQRQGLQTQLDALTQVLTEQSANIRTAPAFAKLSTQDAQLASQVAAAQETTTEKLTSFAVDWVLPVAVGLLLALGLVFLLEKLFPRVDTRDDIQDELGVPVLAEVPRVRTSKEPQAHSLADLHGPDAEMYRSLRSSLEFIAASAHETSNSATNGNGHRRSEVIMIVSPTPAEGKTRSAAYLGLTYAEAGHDVAIFGCDFRRPKLHDYFGVDRDPGFGSLVVNGSVDLDDVVKRTDVEGLSVVPSGSSDQQDRAHRRRGLGADRRGSLRRRGRHHRHRAAPGRQRRRRHRRIRRPRRDGGACRQDPSQCGQGSARSAQTPRRSRRRRGRDRQPSGRRGLLRLLPAVRVLLPVAGGPAVPTPVAAQGGKGRHVGCG